MENELVRDVEQSFARLCTEVGRRGVIGFASVEGVRLLPEQAQRLQQKLSTFPAKAGLSTSPANPANPANPAKNAGRSPAKNAGCSSDSGSAGRRSGNAGRSTGPAKNAGRSTGGEDAESSAVSLGLFYHESEVLAIPATWQSKSAGSERWNDYARAYQELNRTLDYVSSSLAAEFGGVAEKATIEGWAGKVQHVGDYFAHCVSHRAFAEAAGLGWRGRHGLIVTPEAGPALRFATVFVPYQPRTGRGMEYRVRSQHRELVGCGDCHACLDVCPVLREVSDYREACRRRIHALGLAADVCGICVRVCWEQVRR